jgi:hypothetical protein
MVELGNARLPVTRENLDRGLREKPQVGAVRSSMELGRARSQNAGARDTS